MVKHDCEVNSITKVSTNRAPYHFVGCGLRDVYLVGVKYSVCAVCGNQAAELPVIGKLLDEIATAVADSSEPLTGAQIRFLRRRLWKSAQSFADLVGVTREQVSRWENDRNRPESSADKLIRMLVRYGEPALTKRRTSDRIVIDVIN